MNNDTYLLFRAMEVATRRVLKITSITHNPGIKIKQEIHHSVLNDPFVAAHWSCLLSSSSVELELEESEHLLEEICDKWVTIRGHSFASAWVEQYQLAAHKTTKKFCW